MSARLPEPLAANFAGVNIHDIDAMLAPFSEAAVVKDEGHEKHGLTAITGWIEKTTRAYGATIAVTGDAEVNDKTAVKGSVAGDFPDSPLDPHSVFLLDDNKIARLEIF